MRAWNRDCMRATMRESVIVPNCNDAHQHW
jgi:hypothetical protein